MATSLGPPSSGRLRIEPDALEPLHYRSAPLRIGAIILIVALAAGACSSGDGFATDIQEFTTTTTASTTTSTAPVESTVPITSTTPEQSDDEFAALLGEVIEDAGLPALGVTVFDSDSIIESAVAGVRRNGDPTPVELADKFHLGSNAKAMTATLVATYVDEGILSWDTTITEVYGDVLPAIDEGLADVTIRDLLNHTSGLDDELALTILQTIDTGLPVVAQRAKAAEITLAQAGHDTRGQYAYSNVGYTIVGGMLEQLTGSSWEALVRTRLFDPLNIESCGFYAPGTPGELDEPWGHWTDDGGRAVDPGDPDSDYPRAIAPAGLVHCNMADWARFLQSQLRGFQGSDTEMISQQSFSAIQAPPDGGEYSLGWGTMPTPLGTAYWHHGGNDRFTSFVVLDPQTDSGILVVTNIGEVVADPAINAAITAVSEYAVAQDQVDIGGRKMFITCKGSGSPTVVLEHGLGATGADWAQVQKQVSNSTRVCYTSRPGMGYSDSVPGVRTAQDAADDLAAVLTAAQVPGPYVVVGHSFGGLVVRLFADQHPDDVVGVVLVDTSHEDQVSRVRDEISHAAWSEASTFFVGANNAERMDLDASAAEVAAIGDLGELPLVVLQAGASEEDEAPPGISQETIDEVNAAFRQIGTELQMDLASLSSIGKHVLVEDSRHFVQLDRPDAVVSAIGSVLEEVR